jgi:hypothetical protein
MKEPLAQNISGEDYMAAQPDQLKDDAARIVHMYNSDRLSDVLRIAASLMKVKFDEVRLPSSVAALIKQNRLLLCLRISNMRSLKSAKVPCYSSKWNSAQCACTLCINILYTDACHGCTWCMRMPARAQKTRSAVHSCAASVLLGAVCAVCLLSVPGCALSTTFASESWLLLALWVFTVSVVPSMFAVQHTLP